jgi:hypothetical protein
MDHPLLRGRDGMDRIVARAALRLLELTREPRENTVNAPSECRITDLRHKAAGPRRAT